MQPGRDDESSAGGTETGEADEDAVAGDETVDVPAGEAADGEDEVGEAADGEDEDGEDDVSEESDGGPITYGSPPDDRHASTEPADRVEPADRDERSERVEVGVESGSTGSKENQKHGADRDAEVDRDADGSANRDADGEADTDRVGSVEDVETVVVDPGDVFEGLVRNAGLDERAEGKAVLQLSPPFRERAHLEVYHLDEEEDWSETVHFRPFRFVREGRGLLEQYPTRELARSELGEDADEAAVDEWLETARERWASYVRDNLVDVVDVFTRQGMLVVEVEFEDDVDGIGVGDDEADGQGSPD